MGKATRSSYLMENEAEAERLEAKTDAALARRQLQRVGLRKGMRALDAGAATGAVAREMARIVGPTGSATALDLSRERLAYGKGLARRGQKHLGFVAGNLLRVPFADHSFDFAWARFVFEYLDRPDDVLSELIRVTRPGGKVVIAEIDGHALFHHPLPPRLEKDLSELMTGLKGRFDPYAGRKLFHRFVRAGLGHIQVHVQPYHLHAGRAGPVALHDWTMKLRGIAAIGAKVLGTRRYQRFASDFIAFLKAPDTFTYSVIVIVEGRKPKA